ncbi:SDR family oxidoreductase [Streptomyces sp. MMG1121]|uniref:SDR family oxidoreductase n=1 Tax=Streptomyces sp. MMG1121 TaxID=1415544 RepID=UPI0018FEB696
MHLDRTGHPPLRRVTDLEHENPQVAKSAIRVNAVAPGPTDTGTLTRFTGIPENKAALVLKVPLARLGLPEELADAIAFMASNEGFIDHRPRPQRRWRSHHQLTWPGTGVCSTRDTRRGTAGL